MTAPTSISTAVEYGVVDYALILKVVFGFLYGPYPGHSRPVTATALAYALAAAEKGNGFPLWELQKNNTEALDCRCGPGPVPTPYKSPDAIAGIACSDGEVVNDSPEDLEAVFNKLVEDSMFGLLWGGRIRCVYVLLYHSMYQK